jgi:adenylosuccinate lyase
VLAEAVQTVMRAHGIPNAYDQLKSYTRGRAMDERSMRDFIDSLALPSAAKESLGTLLPRTYLGLAPRLAHRTRTSS